MRIVLTGGGTGGHLIPFEPIIEALRTAYLENKAMLPPRVDPEKLELTFLGVLDQKAIDFFAHFDVVAKYIPSGKLRRYFSHLTISDLLFFMPFGIVKALYQVWLIMPDVIVSKGGYGSIPVLIAATVLRIPYVLHESDVMPGLSNRLAARFAAAVTVGFSLTKENMKEYGYKTFVTGTPVRNRLGLISPAEARKSFGYKPADLVILVLGGSQGAAQLNEIVLQVLPELILEASIIHITGESHYTKIATVASELLESSSRKENYKPYPYLPETVLEAIVASDIVVSRAGATTLAELTRLRKPTLLVPLSTAANDHQRANAQVYEHLGAARVLDPNNLSRNLFLQSLQALLKEASLREQLSANMAQLDTPHAARSIADIAFKLAVSLVPVPEAT